MRKILNLLSILFFVFSLFSPLSYADSVGLGSPLQNNPPAPLLPQTPDSAASNLNPSVDASLIANQNLHTAVGYDSLPQNLTPKEPIVLAMTDCVDAKGELKNQYGETTVCPEGYLPHEIDATAPPVGNPIFTTFEAAFGKVYYRLRCCKSYVSYS